MILYEFSPEETRKIFLGHSFSEKECLHLYNEIVSKAKERVPDKSIHEFHHIVPKCLGGDNSRVNLSPLYYDEHFFVHVLLTRFYPNDVGKRNKMLNCLVGVVCKNGIQPARNPKIWQVELAKEAFSEKLKGNTYASGQRWTLTKEQCLSISSRLMGNKLALGNQNAKGKNLLGANGRATRVKCVNDGRVFSTIKEAALFYNVNGGKIGEVCRGGRKHTGGLRFEYYG